MKTYDEMDFNAAVFREISRFWPSLTPSLKDFISSALSGNDGEVFTDGASNIFRYREYHDVDKARALLDFVDDDENLKLLVGDTEEGECRTVIGRETGISALSDCSLVVKTYSPSDNMKGSIGIIGPARMDYSRVM